MSGDARRTTTLDSTAFVHEEAPSYLNRRILGGCHIQNVCDTPSFQFLQRFGVVLSTNVHSVTATASSQGIRHVHQAHTTTTTTCKSLKVHDNYY